MKKNLFLFAAVLLMLAGCSSNDDEITINDGNILGYWESKSHESDQRSSGDPHLWRLYGNPIRKRI